LEYVVIKQKINMIDTHAIVVPFCIKEVWPTLTLNYLRNFQYKSNNWTIIMVLREKWKLFFSTIHFIQLKNFLHLEGIQLFHTRYVNITTNCICVPIVPLFCWNRLVYQFFILFDYVYCNLITIYNLILFYLHNFGQVQCYYMWQNGCK